MLATELPKMKTTIAGDAVQLIDYLRGTFILSRLCPREGGYLRLDGPPVAPAGSGPCAADPGSADRMIFAIQRGPCCGARGTR